MGLQIIIGIMGPGETATEDDKRNAVEAGKMIGSNGWIVLTGGRNSGVMAAASRGAKQAGGTTVGILPGTSLQEVSDHVDIPILTGLGHGRNYVNILSSRVIVGIGLGPGTASELSLALKAGRPIILYQPRTEDLNFFCDLAPDLVQAAQTIDQLEDLVKTALANEV